MDSWYLLAAKTRVSSSALSMFFTVCASMTGSSVSMFGKKPFLCSASTFGAVSDESSAVWTATFVPFSSGKLTVPLPSVAGSPNHRAGWYASNESSLEPPAVSTMY